MLGVWLPASHGVGWGFRGHPGEVQVEWRRQSKGRQGLQGFLCLGPSISACAASREQDSDSSWPGCSGPGLVF